MQLATQFSLHFPRRYLLSNTRQEIEEFNVQKLKDRNVSYKGIQ